MSSTLYDILGIPPSAQSEEIKTAYKQLAKKHHPDKNPGDVWHEEQFKKINQAYQILSDPYKKKQYDNRLEYEAFQKQNPTSSSNNTRQPYKRSQPPKRPVKKDPWAGYKMYLVIAGVFLFTGILGYFFYNFMNHYTAQDLFQQAKAMDDRARYKEAFMLYTDALSFDKEYSEAYEKRGDARINAIGDYKSAEFDYTNAIVNTDKPSGNLYFKRAKCLLELKKYNLALIDLDSIVKRDKTFDSAFFYKAEVNYFLENYQQAIPAYTSFLTLHPQASEAILKRGFCYYKTEQFENALGDFDQILRIQPQDGETFYYRGITRFALKDSLQGCNDLNYSYLFGFTEAGGVQKKYCK